MDPKYNITVKLVGKDGNIFNLMGIVQKALRQNDVPKDEIDLFLQEIESSHSFYHALQVIMEWVHVE